MSVPFARAIARPLEHLSGVARRLGAGDLQARARLDRRDEIGELARTFDETAERVGRLLEGQRELLANVSHELRTPLARIRVSLALAAEASPEDVPRHLAAIEGDAGELERLVADLLTTSRLDAGGALSLQRAPDGPGGTARAGDRTAGSPASRTDRGSQTQPTPAVSVEAGLIARVLDNVLDNAAKYSEADKPIGVSLEPADQGVRVTVRDRGSASRSKTTRACSRRSSAATAAARATPAARALGSTLSKQIVDAHGGRITVDSRPGAGTPSPSGCRVELQRSRRRERRPRNRALSRDSHPFLERVKSPGNTRSRSTPGRRDLRVPDRAEDLFRTRAMVERRAGAAPDSRSNLVRSRP